MESTNIIRENNKKSTIYFQKFHEFAPFLFGLTYVFSGWDWDGVPPILSGIFWIFQQRGFIMWIWIGLFYLADISRWKENPKQYFINFLFIGIGFFVATRVGYGSLLRSIQIPGLLIHKIWGWFQAILMGTSWGMAIISVLFVFENKIWQDTPKKSIFLSLVIMGISLVLNLTIPLLGESYEKLAEMCWVIGLLIASFVIIRKLNPESRKQLWINVILCIIFFVIGALITSYYNPPAEYSIDRHKIAELTWGFGMGLGVNYVFNRKFNSNHKPEVETP
jgi:hypothetical protein